MIDCFNGYHNKYVGNDLSFSESSQRIVCIKY